MDIRSLLLFVFQILIWLIVARALLSWFPDTRNNQLVQVLIQITDTFLQPIARVVPRMGMMDLSPMIAILILIVLSAAVR